MPLKLHLYILQLNSLEVVELLLEYGADPNAEGEDRRKPLHYAAQYGHDRIVQLLLEYWADPNAKNDSGSTPLHIAAKGKNTLVVKLLLDSRADPEARDNTESTPRFYPTQEDIAQLLNGREVVISHQNAPRFPIIINGNMLKSTEPATEKVVISQQTQNTPKFPITINGNVLMSTESLQTNYILIQSLAPLNPSDRQALDDAGAKYLDYVSKNTYLYQYQDEDLEKIRKLDPTIVYVDFYRTEFKVPPSLKEAKQQDQACKVDIIFHESVDHTSVSLRKDIAERSGCSEWDIEFLPNKARLMTRGHLLEAVASIDDVRRIEDVGEVVMCNDVARQILNINVQQPAGLIGQKDYQWNGEVIAVADTGLCRGENGQIHPAFGNRVQRWFAEHNSTADYDGHGTHVCGSAVGNGTTANGRHVMGTAPQARLVIQSIWDSTTQELRPPSNLTMLFGPPYQEEAVRVHSNSWVTLKTREDIQGNPKPFKQMEYTSAADVDNFVCDHLDMVICFAAGNDGSEPIVGSDLGHIGAQAAAKNCITVGASGSLGHPQGTHPNNVADFSSCGPTKSGHRKPDVVAPGTWILSTNSGNVQNPDDPGPDNGWCYMSGTSMATPLVAGCAAVLREALTSRYPTLPSPFPTAALIKALLINGAEVLNPTSPRFVPSKNSGFGRVDMANAIAIVHGTPETGFLDGDVSNGNLKWNKEIEVLSVHATLKATLVWSDPPGDMLNNQLHLEVQDTTRSIYALGKNNIQQVVWSDISPGKVTLNVSVIARNLVLSPQAFTVSLATLLGRVISGQSPWQLAKNTLITP